MNSINPLPPLNPYPKQPIQQSKKNNRPPKMKKTKTYNSWDSLVVTHPTTNQPACGLSMAERTGSPVFHTLWSYVIDKRKERTYDALKGISPPFDAKLHERNQRIASVGVDDFYP
jgi:hypothetical protein